MFVDSKKYDINLRKHIVFSEAHRKKLSEAATGKKGYWTGKTRPDSTRKKMSDKRLNAYNIKYEYKGKTVRDWAEYFQIDIQQIYAFVKKHGIENIESFISPSELTKYKGKSYAQWAEELNVNRANISYHMKKYGHLDNVGRKSGYKIIRESKYVYKNKKADYWAEYYNCHLHTIRAHLNKYGNLDRLKRLTK